MKTVNLVTPQGQPVSVPQEQVVPLLRSGFGAMPGQRLTLADATEVPIERVVESLGMPGPGPRLETQQETFKRGAEERFGGAAGLGAGLAYGALQGASLGAGGRALIESGMVAPETLAQLESARGGGLLSTIGAGEVIGALAGAKGLGALRGAAAAKGLGALRGAAAAGGAAAETAAAAGGAAAETAAVAKGAGRRLAETVGKEAAIGAGYGAGSELTQAGIEGRQAQLGEAGLAGAGVGAGFGLVGTLAGAGARKAFGKKDAAAARALADIEAIPQQTPGSVDKAVLESRLSSVRDTARQYAKDMATRLSDIVTRINDTTRQAEDLGYSIGGKAVKKADATIERLNKSIASLDANIASEKGLETFQRTLADAIENKFAQKKGMRDLRAQLERDYAAARSEYDAAVANGRQGLQLDNLLTRKTKLEDALGAITKQEENLANFGSLGVQLADVTAQLAERTRARGAVSRRMEAITAKLGQTSEAAADLAGAEATTARQEAATLMREAGTLADQAGMSEAERIASGIHGSRFSKFFGTPSLEAARGTLDDLRSVVRDIFTVERGTARRAAEGEGAKKASAFAEMFRDSVIRQALTPENAAYIRAIAAEGQGLGLLRTGRKATRIPGIVKAIDEQFAREGGLEAMLGADRYAEIASAARSDAQAALAQTPTKEAADAVLQKYAARKAAGVAEAAAGPAVPAAPTVASKDIVATNPAQTEPLRKTLAGLEAQRDAIDAEVKNLGNQRENLVRQRSKLSETIASSKRTAKKEALSTAIDALDNRIELVTTAQDAARQAKDTLASRANDLRSARSLDAMSSAEASQDVAAGREALAEARRTMRQEKMAATREKLGEKLTAAQQTKVDLEGLVAKHRAAQEELNGFIARGEKFVKPGAARGQLVPMAEEAIFNARMDAFMKSAEGKELQRAMREAMGGKGPSVTTKDVVGILGMEALATSLLGPAMGTLATGALAAGMSGKKGVWKAAATLMNPVKFWNVTGSILDGLSKTATSAGRRTEMKRSYQFPVPEANAYLDSILADRADAEKAFGRLMESGVVSPKNVEEGRRRFNAAVDYLERKRPPTSNGADAQAFARSVALVKNPELLTKFVQDGALRQQDVDLLQRISPESYEQLRSAVELLHQQKLPAAMNLAPLFKIMTKSKVMMRTTLPLVMLQQMSGASMGAEQEAPMQAKSEAEAARGRAARADKSSIVQAAKNE